MLEDSSRWCRLRIEGMMCQKSCGGTVQRALSTTKFFGDATGAVVRIANVSFADKEAWVNVTASDQLLSSTSSTPQFWSAVLSALSDSVDAVGFEVISSSYEEIPPDRIRTAAATANSGILSPPAPAFEEPSHSPLEVVNLSSIDSSSTISSTDALNLFVVVLKVSGMTCANCVRSLEQHLKRLSHLTSVRIALLAERAEIEFFVPSISEDTHVSDVHDNAETKKDEIITKIQSLGYSAAVIEMFQMSTSLGRLSPPRTFVYSLSGLSSRSCAQKIITTLTPKRGVMSADVDMNTAKLTVVLTTKCHGSAEADQHAMGPRDVQDHVIALGYGCAYDAMASDARAAESRGEGGAIGGSDLQSWRRNLLIALLFGLPVVCVQLLLSFSSSATAKLSEGVACSGGVTLGQLLMLLLNSPIQFVVGYRFYRSAILSAMNMSFGMDCLVVTGTSIAFFYSCVQMGLACVDQTPNVAHVFFEASGMLILFVTIGKFLEAYSKKRTASAISELMQLQPRRVSMLIIIGIISFIINLFIIIMFIVILSIIINITIDIIPVFILSSSSSSSSQSLSL